MAHFQRERPRVRGTLTMRIYSAAGRSVERRVAMNRNRRAARPRRPSSCISRATRCLPMAYPALAQGAVDSRRAVDAPALAVHGADPVDQDRALPVPLTAGPPAPGVEAAARHAEDAAQLADSEFAGLLHEPELHFRSFAKYAKAFFKMSRSWVTSRSFCSSSRTRRACGARR